jgi:hypothetical protein
MATWAARAAISRPVAPARGCTCGKSVPATTAPCQRRSVGQPHIAPTDHGEIACRTAAAPLCKSPCRAKASAIAGRK